MVSEITSGEYATGRCVFCVARL